MKLFGFDIETTGVDRQKTTPVQICLVQVDTANNARRVLMNTRVNPCQPIEREASETHGIYDRDVVNMPDYAIAVYQLKLLLSSTFNRETDILVTMNGKAFDIPIIDRCIGESVFGDVKHFDVYQAACRYYPDLGSRKLGDLYKHFLGADLDNAHDAAVDVIASLAIAEVIQKKSLLKWVELVNDLATPKPYSIMPFGKYKGTTVDLLPKSWARFMSTQEGLSGDLKATVDYVLGGVS